jgi:hypothetical protein
MIVSKPCIHPECPPRQGYIRGQYESVEIIREIPSDKPTVKRTRSSIDLGNDPTGERQALAEDMGREAILRAARKAAENKDGRVRGTSVDSAPAREDPAQAAESALDDDEEFSAAVEWLMVTRSDPGGSVPRFMIEKGTPGGIVTDAAKFVKWCTSKAAENVVSSSEADNHKSEAVKAEKSPIPDTEIAAKPTSNLVSEQSAQDESVPSSNGLYGIISGAFGAVATRLPNGLPNPFAGSAAPSTIAEDEEDAAADSDNSSVASFASALEGDPSDEGITPPEAVKSEILSTHSSESLTKSNTPAQSEKELKKLQERRRKVQEKMAKMQERISSKRIEDNQRDAAALAKLRDKHEREIAKQEESTSERSNDWTRSASRRSGRRRTAAKSRSNGRKRPQCRWSWKRQRRNGTWPSSKSRY